MLPTTIEHGGGFINGGGRITSSFGKRVDPFDKSRSRFHSGIDIAFPVGSSIYPISKGVVVFTGVYKGFGNLVVINHGNGITSHYAHLSNVKVNVGERVGPPSTIGLVGRSGQVTGVHLHFEIRHKGHPVDPLWILGTQNESLVWKIREN